MTRFACEMIPEPTGALAVGDQVVFRTDPHETIFEVTRVDKTGRVRLRNVQEDFDAGLVVALQQPVQLAGDDTPQAPLGVTAALAFASFPLQVCACGVVVAGLRDRDPVERGVELPVAAAVEPVALGSA